jgi:LPS-assembly lipoprotein
MSLSKPLNRRVALLGLFALSGCGFTPVYGTNGSASALLGTVNVQEPNDRETFVLTRQLERRLGRADSPSFDLVVSLTVSEDAVAITQDGDISRYNVVGRAQFTLSNRITGEIASNGQVSSFTSYSAIGTTFATLVAQEDARDRLTVALTDLILTRLTATVL